MIRVSHLTKKYGAFTAVDDVSFRVEPGEIVGFLGPNGAGKTTTMRILAGFIPATGGAVEVAGYDVSTDSLAVRKRIGYLPERNPLYQDMRVNEYLAYRARLKGVGPTKIRERMRVVREQCGLDSVRRKIIGTLSKGFQQRVGLADALIHNPELLILDEPTQGLDPNQIRHVRQLIRELATRHTILLSTHILSEVEMTCQKVIIINHGKIIASDTLEHLRETWCGLPNLVAEIQGPKAAVLERLLSLEQVAKVRVVSEDDERWTTFHVAGSANLRPDDLPVTDNLPSHANGAGTQGNMRDGRDLAAAVFDAVRPEPWRVRRLELEQRTLEDVFVEVTQRHSQQNGNGDTPRAGSSTLPGSGTATGSEHSAGSARKPGSETSANATDATDATPATPASGTEESPLPMERPEQPAARP